MKKIDINDLLTNPNLIFFRTYFEEKYPNKDVLATPVQQGSVSYQDRVYYLAYIRPQVTGYTLDGQDITTCGTWHLFDSSTQPEIIQCVKLNVV